MEEWRWAAESIRGGKLHSVAYEARVIDKVAVKWRTCQLSSKTGVEAVGKELETTH